MSKKDKILIEKLINTYLQKRKKLLEESKALRPTAGHSGTDDCPTEKATGDEGWSRLFYLDGQIDQLTNSIYDLKALLQ